jgi:hypothetical protein
MPDPARSQSVTNRRRARCGWRLPTGPERSTDLAAAPGYADTSRAIPLVVGLDLDEALDKSESRVRDLAPATIDDERVPAVRHLNDLSHALVPLLLPVAGVGDGPRNRVVSLTRNDQQRSPLRILGVDLRLRSWVDVGGCCLE